MKTHIKNLFLLPSLIAGLGLIPAGRVTAQNFTNLYDFTGFDGAEPAAGLVLSGDTLYGTAQLGGSWGHGTVFKMNTAGTDFTNLHDFTVTSTNLSGVDTNSDGTYPNGLILLGNTLYGTASGGGSAGSGTVFAVNTNGTGFANLHTFTAASGAYPHLTNTDGVAPAGGLVLSGNMLYGTTQFGGSAGNGTVFAVNPNGTGFTNLHVFTATSSLYPNTNSDGANPQAGLILSGSTLYGTASGGGSSGGGTVFKLNTDGTGFTNLHSLKYSSDGGNPSAELVLSGNTLYGTASDGGSSGNGTVFAVNTDGTGFANLHNFAGHPSDGANPRADLLLLGSTLYGTAGYGGSSFAGTVFAVNTDGTGFVNLHSFTFSSDGGNPLAGLILSGHTLYGTAYNGGSYGDGTVFSLWLWPTVQFTANPSNGAPPLTVQFNCPGVDSSGSNIVSWNWNFGDGGISTLQNPSHIYSAVGTYAPALVATNSSGVAVVGTGPSISVGFNLVVNLVVNGGFETGYFTAWTLVDSSSGTFVDDGATCGIAPHAGTYLAGLGAVGTLGYLSQTLTTIPGQSYLLSLWLNSPDGRTPNEFLVSWNGSTIFDQINIPALGWTNLQFTVTAAGTSTILQFGSRDEPSYLGLDDVSVLPVSVSAPQLAILHSGANVILTWPTNAAGFTLQSTTNLVSPAVWSTVSPAPVVVNGQNAVTNPSSGPQKFYRLSQ